MFFTIFIYFIEHFFYTQIDFLKVDYFSRENWGSTENEGATENEGSIIYLFKIENLRPHFESLVECLFLVGMFSNVLKYNDFLSEMFGEICDLLSDRNWIWVGKDVLLSIRVCFAKRKLPKSTYFVDNLYFGIDVEFRCDFDNISK